MTNNEKLKEVEARLDNKKRAWKVTLSEYTDDPVYAVTEEEAIAKATKEYCSNIPYGNNICWVEKVELDTDYDEEEEEEENVL